MRIIDFKIKKFDQNLDRLLLQRRKKINSSSVSVTKIIKDVKKMETKLYWSMKKNLIKIAKSKQHLNR